MTYPSTSHKLNSELFSNTSNIFFIKMENVLANLEGSNFKNFPGTPLSPSTFYCSPRPLLKLAHSKCKYKVGCGVGCINLLMPYFYILLHTLHHYSKMIRVFQENRKLVHYPDQIMQFIQKKIPVQVQEVCKLAIPYNIKLQQIYGNENVQIMCLQSSNSLLCIFHTFHKQMMLNNITSVQRIMNILKNNNGGELL